MAHIGNQYESVLFQSKLHTFLKQVGSSLGQTSQLFMDELAQLDAAAEETPPAV